MQLKNNSDLIAESFFSPKVSIIFVVFVLLVEDIV